MPIVHTFHSKVLIGFDGNTFLIPVMEKRQFLYIFAESLER